MGFINKPKLTPHFIFIKIINFPAFLILNTFFEATNLYKSLILQINMNPAEEKVRKTLDELLENVKTIEDLNNIQFLIDDYIEEGYNIKDYISKYNSLVQKFYAEKIEEPKERLKSQKD